MYLSSGGTLTTIADTGARQPESGGAFSSFGPLSVDETAVAFAAAGSNEVGSLVSGIYLADGASIRTIADTDTPIPEGTGSFVQFRTQTSAQGPALDEGEVVFSASGPNGQQGVYATFGGSLYKVIDLDDLLDGKKLTAAATSVDGFDAGQIALWARFADGSEGIYLATAVSEPGSWALVAAGMFLFACAVRWRGSCAQVRRDRLP